MLNIATKGKSNLPAGEQLYSDYHKQHRLLVSVLKQANALEREVKLFRSLVENSPDSVARYDRECRHIYANPAFGRMVNGGAAALLRKRPSESLAGNGAGFHVEKIRSVIASGEDAEFELQWQDKDGQEICSLVRLTAERGDGGQVESVLAVGRDITELNAIRRRIHQMAFYDELTSLPNRALLNDRLRQMLTDVAGHGQLAGLMMVDLDRFKDINDTLGHAAGDALLREAAVRMKSCVRAYDTVARLGGDEFAILLPDISTGEDLATFADKLLTAFNAPFKLGDTEVFVTCCIGIALYPGDSIQAEELLKYADSAMSQAKGSGRNNYRFYSKELFASASERLTLEADLRRGIARGELDVHFQPKVSLSGGLTVGSEALLRWCHPQHGMVPPDRFIPIAENCGLIMEIGEWVLRMSCQAASEWNRPGNPLHKVAVNLSARQFQSGDLVATVRGILAETKCRPEWLELEITESLLLDEDGEVRKTLMDFRGMGITIAIDDFGTGYSALSYLARFPIDTLKIDRSFIDQLGGNGHHAELVKAIISIADCLGQKVVAEGVETAEQADFLRSNGCAMAQGYFYGRPMGKPGFEAWIATTEMAQHDVGRLNGSDK